MARLSYTTAMSYFDGPNRTMSVMNVPVDVSNFVTPFSSRLIHSW